MKLTNRQMLLVLAISLVVVVALLLPLRAIVSAPVVRFNQWPTVLVFGGSLLLGAALQMLFRREVK